MGNPPDAIGRAMRADRDEPSDSEPSAASTARAALWPGIPLTPPPRRAPAPHSHTFACSVSTPHVPTSSSDSANGHARSRWKMCPRGMPSSASISGGVSASRHGVPSGARSRQSSSGSDQRRVERAERGVDSAALGAVVGEQPRRHVQPEQRERLHPPGPQLVRQDARIGQRVAVDLARRHGRDATGAGLGVGDRQLLIALVDVKRPRERFLRAGSRHARQALEQHVDLELGSLRGLARRGLAEQPAEHVRCDAGEHVPGAMGTPVGARDLSRAPVGGDRHHLRAGDELGSGGPRGAGERGRQRPHASDRHVPAAADDVVQEAPVLAQQRVVGRSERPNQAVGQDRASG